MLARGPVPDAGGTTVVGGPEAEKKLTNTINDVHNLQLQYNKGKEEIERWIREKQDLTKQIHDLGQQKKDAQNRIKDQNERNKLEGQKADVLRLQARASGEDQNVKLQGQLSQEQQALKNTELGIQLAKQDISKNNLFQELQRVKDQNRSKNIELQALKQTLESAEFKNPDQALMDQYRQAQIKNMEIEHMKQIMKLNAENNIEKARLDAMNKANQDFQSNLPQLQKQKLSLN